MENNFLLKLTLKNTSGILKYDYDENRGILSIFQTSENIKSFYRKFKVVFKKYFEENKLEKLNLQLLNIVFHEDIDNNKKMILAYSLFKCYPFITKLKTGIKLKFVLEKKSINCLNDVMTDINFTLGTDNKCHIYFTSTKYLVRNLCFYLSDYMLLNHTNNFENSNMIFINTLKNLINDPIENVECIRLPRLDLMNLDFNIIQDLLEVLKAQYFSLRLISFNFDIFLKTGTDNSVYSSLEILINLIYFISKTFTNIFVIINLTFSNLDEYFPFEEFIHQLRIALDGYSICKKILINLRCFCKVYLNELQNNSELLKQNIFSVGRRININKYLYRRKDYSSAYLFLWMKKNSKVLSKLKHQTIFLILSKFLQGYKIFTFDKYLKTNLEENITTNEIIMNNFHDEELQEILKNTDKIDLTKLIIHNYTYNPLE